MNSGDWNGLHARIERTMTSRGRRQCGSFAIEGFRLHERAARSGVSVQAALISETLRSAGSSRIESLLSVLEGQGCRLVTAPDDVLDSLTAGRGLGAIVGLVALPDDRPLAPLLTSRFAGGHRDANHAPVVLVAVEIEDPGNVGALVRTGLAVGAAALVAVGVTDPFHPRAVQTSMGSLFKLPIVCRDDAEAVFAELDSIGEVTRVGAVAEGGLPLPELQPSRGVRALFLGSESTGLAPQVCRRLDERVTIPMPPGVDSLSVNAAAAILLYALVQGGGLRPPSDVP